MKFLEQLQRLFREPLPGARLTPRIDHFVIPLWISFAIRYIADAAVGKFGDELCVMQSEEGQGFGLLHAASSTIGRVSSRR